jgi:DNA-binding MurR/RpiR family transcriptional regulator
MQEELDGLRNRLEQQLYSLSKSQQIIANYLLTSYDEAAFFSAADLAQRLNVSEATVVRFAKAIGYSGFPELKRCLQDLYRDQVTPATRLQHKLVELASHQGHVLAKVIDMEVQYLTEAAHTVSLAEFDRAVEIILNGKRVFVRGGGPSAILADLLELRLRRFGIFALSLTDSARDLIEKLQLLQPDDAVIATGFHHISAELAAVVEHAHSLGCPTILITDTLGAAFQGKADVVLAARRGPVSTFHSLTVPMAIVNALILAVAMARPTQSVTALDRMQQMRATYGFDVPVKVAPRTVPAGQDSNQGE